MMAIVCGSVAEARACMTALDAAFGYPKPGISQSTGRLAGPNQDGWTASYSYFVESGGAWYVVVQSAADAAIIGRKAVNASIPFGDTTTRRIDHWSGDNPVLVEVAETYTNPLGDLEKAKADALHTLDAAAAAARRAGFTFNGMQFNLDHNAVRQVELADKWASEKVPEMRYPLAWTTIDAKGVHQMQTAEDVRAFALAYSLADRALTERFAYLAMQVQAATSVEQIAAIVKGTP